MAATALRPSLKRVDQELEHACLRLCRARERGDVLEEALVLTHIDELLEKRFALQERDQSDTPARA